MAQEAVSFSIVVFCSYKINVLENYVTKREKRMKKVYWKRGEKKKEISSFGVKQSSEEKEMFEKICVKVFFAFFRWLLPDLR